MLFQQLSLGALFLAVCQVAQAASIKRLTFPNFDLGPEVTRRSTLASYSLPGPNVSDAARKEALAATRATFLYGPAVAGGPQYPTGSLGNATALADLASLEAEFGPQQNLTVLDSELATEAYKTGATHGLATLADYALLYDNQWKNTLPKGPAPGILSNYTQDLLFSMERLSTSPYAVRRLIPSTDNLAFDVDDSTAVAVSGSTLEELLKAGRLFYIDHSAQGSLERTAAYAAACDAYFFIDAATNNFLPLAIRTNVGAKLVYTPQDQPGDWLLAKIIFNGNDILFAQFNHLAATHEVVQIAWMAAIRTISTAHPVYGILDRLMYQVFAVQPIARDLLFAPGAAVDAIYGYTGRAAEKFTDSLYHGGQGRFQANYFLTDLETRGLINSTVGPELANFPFYEDALCIYNAIHEFMTSFVHSYYDSDLAVLADHELQGWAVEANGPAQVYDFPKCFATRDALVDALTHMAHLASTAHHAVNTNELASVSMTLPFHPTALYQPLPTAKGNTSVVPYLPDFAKAARQLYVNGVFARPLFVGTNRTLLHMFDDAEMLALMNAATNTAAAEFKSSMEAFSKKVSSRTFDAKGLSQGMPFVWQALDPNVAPFSVSI